MSRKIPLHLVALVALLGHSTADAQDTPGKNLISSGGFEGPIANFPKWHTKDQQFENDGCIYCGPSTDEAFRGIGRNVDREGYRLAQSVLGGGSVWLFDGMVEDSLEEIGQVEATQAVPEVHEVSR